MRALLASKPRRFEPKKISPTLDAGSVVECAQIPGEVAFALTEWDPAMEAPTLGDALGVRHSNIKFQMVVPGIKLGFVTPALLAGIRRGIQATLGCTIYTAHWRERWDKKVDFDDTFIAPSSA